MDGCKIKIYYQIYVWKFGDQHMKTPVTENSGHGALRDGTGPA